MTENDEMSLNSPARQRRIERERASAMAKPRCKRTPHTDPKVPPNPSVDRSLIINGRGFRVWDYEQDKWATPVVIASGERDGVFLLGLNERAGALVEIREA